MVFSLIQPYQYVALRLPSDTIKVEQLIPNTLISLGKYGSFQTNQILGRPYHLTFEILERSESQDGRELRIVTAAELHAAALLEDLDEEEIATPEVDDGTNTPTNYKSNENIVDNPTNQRLTMAEIEALKQDEMGSAKDLIAKIMESHSALDQKTAFSLAKYTLRKHKKYLKRFCVLPLDVNMLVDYMMREKDFTKIMEIRNEIIGLIGCWANVHAGDNPVQEPTSAPTSRYLVVDDTGGLLVAAMAERMGVLHSTEVEPQTSATGDETINGEAEQISEPKTKRHVHGPVIESLPNSLTLVHANQQPNLSLLRYFNFDYNNPAITHPLYSHLRTITWLQLVEPELDSAYQEPEFLTPEELSSMKSNRRGNYWRKRKRWEKTKIIVDETQAGGFNGLIIASFTNLASILHRLVPLLAGGSQVVVYSPHIEPLVDLADYYSTAQRTAFLSLPAEERIVPSADFPVDPTLLLVPMVQTSRVRHWQVLPGRSHPLMTGRGGAEGYVFVGTRVLPAEGKVSARGRPPRIKRKVQDVIVPANGDVQDELSPIKKQRFDATEVDMSMEDIDSEVEIDVSND